MNVKRLLFFSTGLILLSIVSIFVIFYYENSDVIPKTGGIIRDLRVGRPETFNPLFGNLNQADLEITSLIYSGLTRYDNEKKEYLPDLATYTIDRTGKTYTFSIIPNAVWHDGQAVTADDIVFTYNTIKDPRFSNTQLRKSFESATITKIDDVTVTFTLTEPYFYFPSLTTIGILPKHIWQSVPVNKIGSSPINQRPIGSGLFAIEKQIEINPNTGSTEINLKNNKDFYRTKAIIDKLVITYVYDIGSLKALSQSADMIFLDDPEVMKEASKYSYNVHESIVPKFVSIYLNTESEIFKDKKVREGFIRSLPVNEINHVIESIGKYTSQVSTDVPAYYENTSKFGDIKKNLISNLDKIEENILGGSTEYKITEPTESPTFNTKRPELFIRGTTSKNTEKVFVNDYVLQKYKPGTEKWEFIASTTYSTLIKGKNIYNIYSQEKDKTDKVFLDSITVNYDPSLKEETSTDDEIKSKPFSIDESGKYVWKDKDFKIRLVIPETADVISQVANTISTYFAKSNIEVDIINTDSIGFQSIIEKNEYDAIIVGFSIDRVIDYFPLFHSSQTLGKGLNLSNIGQFKIDSILTEIRNPINSLKTISPLTINTFIKDKLEELKKVISAEWIMYPLYQPKIYYLTRSGIDVEIPLEFQPEERFYYITNWHLKTERVLRRHPQVGLIEQFSNWFFDNLII